MKGWLWLTAFALLLGLPVAQAQQVLAASSAPPPPGAALPPPGINDPGVKPKPQPTPQPRSIPLPSTSIPPSVAPAARQHDANGQPPPDVAVGTNANGDTIETYSHSGHVYRVHVIPEHGVPWTLINVNPYGSLMHDRRLGAVSPVYYTLFKWGGPKKSQPASASSSGGH